MRRRVITYAIDTDSGMVVSRVGGEIAWPILQWDRIGVDGDFTKPLEYALETIPVLSVGSAWRALHWTRKVPVAIKNRHRVFWGMAQLKGDA